MFSKTKKTKVVDVKSAKPDYGLGGGFLTVLQNVGKSLVFPIAVLPMAALLLRIGTLIAGSDTEWVKWLGIFIESPGKAVFDNLPIIFAIGVAFGFAKDHRGEAALVGALAYFTLHIMVESEPTSLSRLFYQNVMTTPGKDGVKYSTLLYLVPTSDSAGVWLLNMGVFAGIETGLIAAYTYNRWSGKQLHPALAFFSGRRFVPMAVLVIMAFISIITAAIWPWLQLLLIIVAQQIVKIPSLGAGLYAFFNRLLIPFGLHQVLNVFFWFQVPITVHGAQISQVLPGDVLVPLLGDINAFSIASTLMEHGLQISENVTINGTEFIAGQTYLNDDALLILQNAHVGAFQTGYFPIMMGGVPAVALAIGFSAEKERRKTTIMFMGSTALVAFFTGITEPVEYSFMFLSPILFFFYALLSGFVAAGTVATGASIGFGFSAGFVDLIASIPIAIQLSTTGPWVYLIVPAITVLVFPIYFGLMYFLIHKLNLETPGRGENTMEEQHTAKQEAKKKKALNKGNGVEDDEDPYYTMAKETVKLVGGIDKISEIDNCITRVRLQVEDNDISQEKVKEIGYIGYSKVGNTAAQFIIGPQAEIIAKYILQLKQEGYDHTTDIKQETTTDINQEKIAKDDKSLSTDSKVISKEIEDKLKSAIDASLKEENYIEIFWREENSNEISSTKRVLLEKEILDEINQ